MVKIDKRQQLSGLIAFLFQVPGGTFWPFFRHEFGRRFFRFVPHVVLPTLIIVVAVLVRGFAPDYIVYWPLRYLPPFNSDPVNIARMQSRDTALTGEEYFPFLLFALLYLFVSLGHYLTLIVKRWYRTDPTYTHSGGASWLARLPVFRRFKIWTLQGKIEPLIVVLVGYAFCFYSPGFGMYLMAGGLAFGLYDSSLWRQAREPELDARDALVQAELSREEHRVASLHRSNERAREENAAVSEKVIARVQKNPHALLALDPPQTKAVRDSLGGERFSELCDALPEPAQQQVYERLGPGLAAASPAADIAS